MSSKKKLSTVLVTTCAAGAGFSATPPSFGQAALEEVIVTARRVEEGIQDVPISINSLTGSRLSELNIRNFQEVQGVVAGLTLEENTIAPNSSVRGVRHETFSSTSPTIEYYLNDTPVSPLTAHQVMFDISAVEVLRGPQGTLRGRASPSGSITLISQEADTLEFGGFVDVTYGSNGARNLQGALDIPLLPEKLGLRVAGLMEENEINGVKSVFGHGESSYEGDGYRITLNGTPADNLYFKLTYQDVKPEREIFFPVESANRADPSLPPPPRDIRASDRKSVQDLAEDADQRLQLTVLNASWDISDAHQLNYVGSYSSEVIERVTPSDVTNALDDAYPEGLQGSAQNLYTDNDRVAHELRLQSTEPLFGRLSYITGAQYTYSHTTIEYTTPNLLPFSGGFIFDTVIINDYEDKKADSTELSYFLNLTYHVTEDTELSGGLRYIDYEASDYLTLLDPFTGLPGTTLQDGDRKDDETIYLLSLKHNFTDDLMTYASWGTSWRYGPTAIGELSAMPSDLQRSHLTLPPETSESLELGLKSTWWDQRLSVNVAAYYQEFDDYPYYPGSGIYYRSFDAQGNASVAQFSFLSAVPVKARGVEIESNVALTDQLTLGVLFNYAKGKIDDGKIACNDYNPHDGIPDTSGVVPTLADIVAAAGDDNLTECETSQRTNFAPDYSATFSGEYRFAVGSLQAYLRGLWSWYDDTENDPTNPLDDIDSYSIVNLYLGLTEPEGRWSGMLYVKNVFDTEEVIKRSAQPGSVSYAVGNDDPIVSRYREVSLTAPQEIGINLRYNF